MAEGEWKLPVAGSSRPHFGVAKDSKRELQRQLSDPGRSHTGHLAEVARVNTTRRTGELGMIENVEEFRPEFKRSFFGDLGALVQGEVPFVYSWTVKEAPARVACNARVL